MSIGNVVLEKSIYVMNLLDPNKGKLIIQREDLQKTTSIFKKVLTLQKPVPVLSKRIRILILDRF